MIRVTWNGRRNPAFSGVSWFVGAALTVLVAIGAVVLAVVFAATVALVTVVAGGLIAAWAMVWKIRRVPVLQRASTRPVILDARKVGHSWVAYGWDRAPN